ncbi:AraC family transcriptional regulator [Hahella sp. CCB-MM4]|uniref:AraC family transcriptional regulator n=1 Tax=Hahella sp. (strain CCB-MM4) TaxID=1926491 RepID=UPI000B9B69E8|nr:AraC family transcriptional regulator [Hahella sp. CCB-MM4]OZG72220.1 AraC family transcriptional regulator [Hahella sp. CCB-MM4]
MDKITVSSHFVEAAISGAIKQGVEPAVILSKAGIPTEVLRNPKARVSAAQYTKLIQTIWATMQDEFMGFTSLRSKPGTFATMGYLVIHCTTLESVLLRGNAFYSLFEKPLGMELKKYDDQAAMVITSESDLHDPYHFLQESWLVIWHRFSCWLTGQRIILDGAYFNYPEPAHSADYHHLFNCPLHFDQQETRLVFNRKYLHLPVIQDELALKEFLKSSPADLLAKPDDSHTYTARIRAILGKDLSQPLPDFEYVASQVNVSPQTLRRRLKDENTSYQEIKDHMRRDTAIYYLGRHDFSINEIAFKVGFTEPSTFHRAFKKWTGLTPGEYRESSARER